jgi:hypothetical protein
VCVRACMARRRKIRFWCAGGADSIYIGLPLPPVLIRDGLVTGSRPTKTYVRHSGPGETYAQTARTGRRVTRGPPPTTPLGRWSPQAPTTAWVAKNQPISADICPHKIASPNHKTTDSLSAGPGLKETVYTAGPVTQRRATVAQIPLFDSMSPPPPIFLTAGNCIPRIWFAPRPLWFGFSPPPPPHPTRPRFFLRRGLYLANSGCPKRMAFFYPTF